MTETIDAPAGSARLNYVGGAWVPATSGETYTKPNPMRPSEIVGEFSSSSEADAEAAVAAAKDAFAEWAALPMARRAGYLNAAAAVLEARVEQVAQDMTL
jgi:aldehyde dehydrogenase (NAD+)